MPRSQTAADRPIAFALHDTVRNRPQEIFQMSIRPEDLSRVQQSRMTVSQTLGGAWLDSFGDGIPTVNISGTTGWGAGGLPDGFEQFQKLHATVFDKWHKLRAEVAKEGKDPDGIKLIFSDGLDDFVWCMAPQNFSLKRNRSRPLLSQYSISLVKLGDSVLEKPPEVALDLGSAKGLSSLDASIKSINDFAAQLKRGITTALGPLKSGIDGLLKQSTTALASVRKLVDAGMNTVRAVAGPVMEIAQGLTKVAANVFRIMATVNSLPLSAKYAYMRVASAFTNAFCLLRNSFKAKGFLPQYVGLYGSSNCSSTAGGHGVSTYADRNVFPDLFPAKASPVSLSANAEAAIGTLTTLDAQKPPEMAHISGLLATVNSGVTISTSVVDSAVAAARSAAGGSAVPMGVPNGAV